jgi:hypothetical protein
LPGATAIEPGSGVRPTGCPSTTTSAPGDRGAHRQVSQPQLAGQQVQVKLLRGLARQRDLLARGQVPGPGGRHDVRPRRDGQWRGQRRLAGLDAVGPRSSPARSS